MAPSRQRRRPLVFTAASAAAVLALAACSGGEAASDTEKAAAEISVAVLSSPTFNPCVADLGTKFEEKTGTKVKLDVLAFSAMRDKYLAGFSAGTSQYDLVNVDFKWTGEFAEAGFLEDISSAKGDLPAMPSVLVDSYTYKDKLYGVPYQSGSTMMFYRKDILEALGAKIPSSWDEADKLADKIQASPQFAGVSPMSVMGVQDQATAMFLDRYWNMGGGDVQDSGGKPTVDADIAAKAMDSLRKHITKYSPAGALAAGLPDTPAQFIAGNVAMLETFSTRPGTSFDAADPNNKIAGKYVGAPIPGGAAERGGWGFSVTSSSSAKNSALAFAQFLADPANDVYCTAKFGKLPVGTDNFSAKEATAALPFLPEAKAAVETSRVRFVGPNGPTLVQLTNSYVSRFNAGEFPSARDAADQLVAALKNAG